MFELELNKIDFEPKINNAIQNLTYNNNNQKLKSLSKLFLLNP